jgi:hypothetical protein
MPITPDTTLLNKYRIVRLLGEGGVARVWLAQMVAFSFIVERKSFPSPTIRHNLQREYP